MSYSETSGCSKRRDCGCEANPSIECTVRSCAFHCGKEDFCSLERIKVTTHESSPKTTECVDCQSFRPCSDCD